MKKLYVLFILTNLFVIQGGAQSGQAIPPPPCNANDNSGFGGAVGLNRFLRAGDENTIALNMSLYYGGDFNDIFVLYIANGSPGRSIINNSTDDDDDAYRIAITNSDAYGYGSTITFPSGFEATHAIAVDANFGGLWSIPNVGNVGTGELNFIKSVNSGIITPSQDTSFNISFDWADIGLTSADDFYYVGMYVSHEGYTSDEGYGDGILAGTEGADDVVFTGYKSYQYDCNVTLGAKKPNINLPKVYFIDGNLNINSLYDSVNIKVYDINGRLVQQSKHQVYGTISLPMNLYKKQLYFILIEGAKSKRILKVIPH